MFAFGPDESYFFDCPTSAQWRRLPWNFQQIRQRISTAYQICIGPGEDEYAAFYMNKDGNIQYSMNYPNNEILKPVTQWFIDAWKGQPAHDILKSRLVVGPEGTYIAFTPSAIKYGGEKHMNSDLVKILKTQATKGSSVPRIAEAALGVNGSWWVQFTDRTSKYDLAGYNSLENLLRDKVVTDKTINSLVLSTETQDQWFIVYDRKKVRYSLPAQYALRVGPALDDYHASQQIVSGVHDGTPQAGTSRSASAATPRKEDEPPPYIEGNESHRS